MYNELRNISKSMTDNSRCSHGTIKQSGIKYDYTENLRINDNCFCYFFIVGIMIFFGVMAVMFCYNNFPIEKE